MKDDRIHIKDESNLTFTQSMCGLTNVKFFSLLIYKGNIEEVTCEECKKLFKKLYRI